MKKILILHAYNTFNSGSLMMLTNFVHYMSLKKKNYSFYVELKSKEDFYRLKSELKTKNKIHFLKKKKIDYSKLYGKINGFFYKHFFYNKEILKNNYSAIVVLSGDDLSEYYVGWKIFSELLRLYFLSKKLPVFLVGQTIGPFYSWRKKIASFSLKKCNIYLRDSFSKKYLENELKINNAFLSSDLAFFDLPLQKKHCNFYKNFNIKKNNYIVVMPSGLYVKYTSNKNDYISIWVKIIKELFYHKEFKTKKIVILAHVFNPSPFDDLSIINEILDNLGLDLKQNIVIIKDQILPSQSRSIMGNALFTLTGRMHAAISSLQMNKPAISLSYSVKYKGIIGDDLGLNDLVIEAKGENLWKNDLLLNELNLKLKNVQDYIFKKKPLFNKNMIKKKSMSQIIDINNILSK